MIQVGIRARLTVKLPPRARKERGTPPKRTDGVLGVEESEGMQEHKKGGAAISTWEREELPSVPGSLLHQLEARHSAGLGRGNPESPHPYLDRRQG